jgi:hypothetical protein
LLVFDCKPKEAKPPRVAALFRRKRKMDGISAWDYFYEGASKKARIEMYAELGIHTKEDYWERRRSNRFLEEVPWVSDWHSDFIKSAVEHSNKKRKF